MDKNFGKSLAVVYGWDAMRRNLGFFIVLLIVLLFADAAANRLLRFILPEPLEGLAKFVVNTTAELVLLWSALRIHDGRPAELRALLDWSRYGNYLAAEILYGLIVLGGLLLLVVPGIIWAVQFQFAGLIVLDEGLGPVEALRRSSEITRDGRTNLLLFDLLLIGVNLLGFAALVIGLFATIPATTVALVSAYRALQERTSVLTPIALPPPQP